MSQVLVRPENVVNGTFVLDSREAHHVSNVLRKKTGEQITLFDGQGRRFIGELTGTGRGRILKELTPRAQKWSLVLYQGLPKGAKFDFVIEKATELGAARIVPFLSAKNIIKLDAAEAKKKQARWMRVAEAASKQCGRATVPDVDAAKPLEKCADEFKNSRTLFFSVGPQARPLRDVVVNVKADKAGEIHLVVGPESGFSSQEEAWLLSGGATPVSLGQMTLRTETAGLAALAILSYELNDAV